jgi:hypothetical protein
MASELMQIGAVTSPVCAELSVQARMRRHGSILDRERPELMAAAEGPAGCEKPEQWAGHPTGGLGRPISTRSPWLRIGEARGRDHATEVGHPGRTVNPTWSGAS